MFRELTIN